MVNFSSGTSIWNTGLFPFSFSKNVSREEQAKLKPLILERGIEVIEEMGWEFEDTEVWFFGELQVVKQ